MPVESGFHWHRFFRSEEKIQQVLPLSSHFTRNLPTMKPSLTGGSFNSTIYYMGSSREGWPVTNREIPAWLIRLPLPPLGISGFLSLPSQSISMSLAPSPSIPAVVGSAVSGGGEVNLSLRRAT